MSNIIAGVVDYGVGNHASVENSLRAIGLKIKISADMAVLDDTQVLILPGVGAFAPAMNALLERGLVEYLQKKSLENFPIVGMCLGMQLMASVSFERGLTRGLNLIPGEVVALELPHGHTGWNTIEFKGSCKLFTKGAGSEFYFNHSYIYKGHSSYIRATTKDSLRIASIIQDRNTIGFQFHPEKSQQAGRQLLKDVIFGICNA